MTKKNYLVDDWKFLNPPCGGAKSSLENFLRICKKLEDEFDELGIDLVSLSYESEQHMSYVVIVLDKKFKPILEAEAEDFYYFFEYQLSSFQTYEYEFIDWLRKPVPEYYGGCRLEDDGDLLAMRIALDLYSRDVSLPSHDFLFLSSYPHKVQELTK